MNCGHAICCVDCKQDVQKICPICGIAVSYFIHATCKQEEASFSRQMSSMNEDDIEKASNIIRLQDEEDRGSESLRNSNLRMENQIFDQNSIDSSDHNLRKSSSPLHQADEMRTPLQMGTPSLAQMSIGMHKRNNFVTSHKKHFDNGEETTGLNSGKRVSKEGLRVEPPRPKLEQASYISEKDEEDHGDSYAVIPAFKKLKNGNSFAASSRKPSKKGTSHEDSRSLANEDDRSLSAMHLLGHEVKSMRSGMDMEDGDLSNRKAEKSKPRIEGINWNEEVSRDEERSSLGAKTLTESDENHSSHHRGRPAKNSNLPSSEDEEDPSEVDRASSRKQIPMELSAGFGQKNQRNRAFLAQRHAEN
jgi:hypothetical protein